MKLVGAVELIDWMVGGSLEGYAQKVLGLGDEEVPGPTDYLARDSDSEVTNEQAG
jgi:hypothetical protein